MRSGLFVMEMLQQEVSQRSSLASGLLARVVGSGE